MLYKQLELYKVYNKHLIVEWGAGIIDMATLVRVVDILHYLSLHIWGEKTKQEREKKTLWKSGERGANSFQVSCRWEKKYNPEHSTIIEISMYAASTHGEDGMMKIRPG